MSAPMLTVDGLRASYGAAQILYDIGLDVGRGEVVALMGRNGAGKTTTMKAVMGLMAQSAGRVVFDGHDISRRQPYEIARLGLGFVPVSSWFRLRTCTPALSYYCQITS